MKRFICYLLTFFIVVGFMCYPQITTSAVDYSFKLDPNLSKKLEKMNDDEMVSVSIWVEDIDYGEVEKLVLDKVKNTVSKDVIDLFMPNNRIKDVLKNVNEKNNTYKKEVFKQLKKTIDIKRSISSQIQKYKNTYALNSIIHNDSVSRIKYVCKYAPNIEIETNKAKIIQICRNKYVNRIYISNNISKGFIDYPIDSSDRNNTKSKSNSNRYTCWKDYTGITDLINEGVGVGNTKIGLLEISIPYVVKNSPTYGDYYNVFQHMFDEQNPANNKMIYRNEDVNRMSNQTMINNRWHALMSASLIAGQSMYGSGVAPNVSLYCASDGTGYKEAIEWLIDQSVSIVCYNNMKLLWSSESSEYYDESKWLDHISLEHRVNLVIPSGNARKAFANGDGSYYIQYVNPADSVGKNAMGYNSIVVGNYNDYNTGVSAADHSSYCSSNSLSYKPDVISPGTLIGTPLQQDYVSGTSCSAPILAGALSYLYGTYILCQPYLVKSLLIASATCNLSNYNVNNQTSTGFEKRTGAGLFNIYKAYKIMTQVNEYNGLYPYSHFWDYDYDYGAMLSQNAFNSVNYFYIDNTSQDICYSLVWNKDNPINGNSLQQGQNICVYGTVQDTAYPSIKISITAPNGNVYSSYYQNDCKASVQFSPPCIGEYTVTYTLMNNYTLTSPLWYGSAICRNKEGV